MEESKLSYKHQQSLRTVSGIRYAYTRNDPKVLVLTLRHNDHRPETEPSEFLVHGADLRAFAHQILEDFYANPPRFVGVISRVYWK